jgi:hypothetical protein
LPGPKPQASAAQHLIHRIEVLTGARYLVKRTRVGLGAESDVSTYDEDTFLSSGNRIGVRGDVPKYVRIPQPIGVTRYLP